MKNALTEIYTGLKSLFIGLKITLGQFFQPIVTVQYPHQTLKIAARFRGHIELVRDSASGKPKCFVCKLCEKACPSDCITVEGIKPEGAKRKTVNHYRLDFTKCSLCGSCVEACRDGAIRFSREYNLASTNKEDFIMDLFKRLEAEGGAAEVQSPKSKVQSPESSVHSPQVAVQGQSVAGGNSKPEGLQSGMAAGSPRGPAQPEVESKPEGPKTAVLPMEAK